MDQTAPRDNPASIYLGVTECVLCMLVSQARASEDCIVLYRLFLRCDVESKGA